MMSDQDFQARRQQLDNEFASWEDKIRRLNHFLDTNADQLADWEIGHRGEGVLGAYEQHPQDDNTSSPDVFERHLRAVTEQMVERELKWVSGQSSMDRAKHLFEQFHHTLMAVHQMDLLLLARDMQPSTREQDE